MLPARIVFAALWFVVCAQSIATSDDRYLAVFADGTRVSGDDLSGWHEYPGDPRLGEVSLHDDDRPLRWSRDRAMGMTNTLSTELGFVEFVTGDRLPGQVIEFRPGIETDSGTTPPHLVVDCGSAVANQDSSMVRVLNNGVRRIVWHASPRRELSPGTIFYRDGRAIRFTALRWDQNAVRVLSAQGADRVSFLELAEVHFPSSEFWPAYYQEVAVLSPDLQSTLIRLETTDGLVATGSTSRTAATVQMTQRERDLQQSAIQRLDQQQRSLHQRRAAAIRQKNLAEQALKRQETQHAQQLRLAKQAIDRADQRENDLDRRLRERANQHKKLAEDARKRSDELIARRREEYKDLPENERNSKLQAVVRDEERKLNSLKRQQDSQLRQMEQQRGSITSARKSGVTRLQNAEKAHPKNLATRQAAIDRSVQSIAKVEADIVKMEAKRKSLSLSSHASHSPDSWLHMVHPAWSLDPLWVRFAKLRTRWHFAPEEVPLSRIPPLAARQESAFGHHWPWHVDRNANGESLRNDQRLQGWGLGVHATNELRFLLPDCARSFRVRMGLDSAVEEGGCVRASIHLNDTNSKPVFQSDLIIGSHTIVDSHEIPLMVPSGEALELVLVADSAHRDRPVGADPFDIRDHLNWIEPLMILDRQELLKLVLKSGPQTAKSQL